MRRFADIVRQYGDEVTLEIPPSIGPALWYSTGSGRSAADIARGFELVLLDDFLEQARQVNAGILLLQKNYRRCCQNHLPVPFSVCSFRGGVSTGIGQKSHF